MTEVFVARQPIFDRQTRVHAYELLFRSGIQNYFDLTDGDKATMDVISNSLFYIGLEELSNQKKVFINFTANLLLEKVPALLPNNSIVVEILEDVEPTEAVVNSCRQLKEQGYILALDDFVLEDRDNPLLNVVDIIKVDFQHVTTSEQQAAISALCNQYKVELLAEKVENFTDFSIALEAGYTYFQGYFFSKPMVLSGRRIPAHKVTYLKMLQEINKPEVDYSDMEAVIKRDLSMTYKLMRFINSAYFGLVEEVKTIKRALVMLGLREIKKWVAFIALENMAQDKPHELIRVSVTRAILFEKIAQKIGLKEHAAEAFLMGMFTVIDAIMDKPMEEILSRLALPREIKDALDGVENEFRMLLNLVIAYEQGEWKLFSEISEQTGFPETEMPQLYMQWIQWAREIFDIQSEA